MLIQIKEAKLSNLLSIYLIQKAAFKSLFSVIKIEKLLPIYKVLRS